MFSLRFTKEANASLAELKSDKSQVIILKSVNKSLGLLQSNPRHISLQTHEFHSKSGPNGQKIFEAYAQNNTSSAWRIFFYYGPEKNQITILTITKHP